MNIILFGFKLSGKTYYGSLLAKKLQCRFIDTDKLIEDEYLKMAGVKLSCRQIYLEIGSGPFRLLERKVISRLSLIKDSVISLGGGSLLDPLMVKSVRSLGVMVFLNSSKEVIKQRIFSDELPSFIDPTNPKESFDKIYETRRSLYEKIPSYCLNLEGKSDHEVLEELVNVLNQNKKNYGK